MVRPRWILLAAAIAAPGVAWWDAHRGASATFERHARDLAARTAAWKALPPLKPIPLFGEVVPGNGWDLFVRALEGFDALPGPAFEWTRDASSVEEILGLAAGPIEGLRRSLRHSEISPTLPPDVLCPSRLALWGEFKTSDVLGIAMNQGPDQVAGDLLLLGLGMIQVFRRYAQPEFVVSAQIWEKEFLERWDSVLREHALSAGELGSLSRALEAFWAARADVLDASLLSDVLVRGAIVQGLPREEALARGGERPPEEASWRSLFSGRLRDARRLNQFEDFRDTLGALRPRPTRERAAMAPEQQGPGSTRFALLYEAYVATRWTLARVATALAWFEAETGAMPAELRELVPDYLPSLPACPLTGKALGYGPGTVWCHGPDVFEAGGLARGVNPVANDGRIAWTVARQR